MLPYTYVAVYSSPISIMATTMVAALTQMLLSIPPLATSMLIVCNAATFYYFNCLQLIRLWDRRVSCSPAPSGSMCPWNRSQWGFPVCTQDVDSQGKTETKENWPEQWTT